MLRTQSCPTCYFLQPIFIHIGVKVAAQHVSAPGFADRLRDVSIIRQTHHVSDLKLAQFVIQVVLSGGWRGCSVYVRHMNIFHLLTKLLHLKNKIFMLPAQHSGNIQKYTHIPCSCSKSWRASTPLLPDGPAPSSETDSPSRSRDDTELERLDGPVGKNVFQKHTQVIRSVSNSFSCKLRDHVMILWPLKMHIGV